jgi:uncharacterized protein (DUF2147 family)
MMLNAKKLLWSVLSVVLLSSVSVAGVTGNWVTYDDKTGKKKSIIKISKHDGRLSGKITKLFNPATTKCVKCKGKQHNKPIVGMTVFSGLTLKDGKWQGGKILDPHNGKWYTCKIWQEGANLKVRGYILVFYRTQIWKRK